MQKIKNRFKQFSKVRGLSTVLITFGGLVLLYLVFGLINPKVMTFTNMQNLLRSMAKYLLIGVGQSIVMITGNVDLSVGSVVGMSAMISATMMSHGISPLTAILAAILASLVIGLINGVLVGKYRLPPFIATLGTMFLGRGVSYIVNGNCNTDSIVTGLGAETAERFQNIFYYGKIAGIYTPFWIALVLFAVFWFLLSCTAFGRNLYAIGSSEEASRYSGIRVTRAVILAYVIASFCSAVAGLVLCAQSGMGNMDAGTGYEMYAVAAGVIGGISPMGGSGILLGTLVGAAIWQILENGLNLIHAQVGYQRIVIGVIVVGAVLVDALVRNGRIRVGSGEKGGKVKKILAAVCVLAIVGVGGAFVIRTGQQEKTAQEHYRIALIPMDSADIHWISMKNAAQEKAEELGVTVDFLAPDAKDDAKQIEYINNAVVSGYDAIMVAPTSKDAIAGALIEAKKAGVKLIYVDSITDVEAEGTYATDNYAAGKIAGEQMLEALTEKGIDEGRLAIVNLNSSGEPVTNREKGFRDALAGTKFTFLETQYCGGDASKAQNIAENYLLDGVVGIFGANGDCTVGVGNAIKAVGDTEVIGVGFDTSDPIRNLIKDGYLICTMVQNPTQMGLEGVQACVDVLNGKDLGGIVVDTGITVLWPEDIE